MAILLNELKERIHYTMDEETFIDIMEISIEMLTDKFEYEILDNLELFEDLLDGSTEDTSGW